MMDYVLRDVCAAVYDETGRIKALHGEDYASVHEAYGVLSEELYEADIECGEVQAYAGMLIGALHKEDVRQLHAVLDVIQDRAIKAACELIQVAAVCRKAMGGMADGEDLVQPE